MKRLICLVLLTVLLTGCGAKNIDAKPREEERLNLGTCLTAEVYEPLVDEFQERTGIWVEVSHMSARELQTAVREGSCDVALGLPRLLAEELGEAMDKVQEPEEKLVAGCPAGERWIPVSMRRATLIVNPKLVRQNLPDSFQSLTDTMWRGQTALPDPQNASWVLPLITGGTQTRLEALLENQTTLFATGEEAAEAVAEGRCFLGLVPEEAALRQAAEGKELSIFYPKGETRQIVDTAGLSAAGKHKENGQLFLRFLLEEDTQLWLKETCFRGSVLETLAENSEVPVLDTAGEAELLILWTEKQEAQE